MKQVKLSDHHYKMVEEKARKSKTKVEEYLEDLIVSDYRKK